MTRYEEVKIVPMHSSSTVCHRNRQRYFHTIHPTVESY